MPEAIEPKAPAIRSTRIEWLTAIGITLIIVVLHLHFLGQRGGFWRDEVNLLNLARHDSLAAMAHDSFPVLMPLLVHVWSALADDSDTSLRAFGAFVGLGSIAALWLAAWAARRRPPVLGLALFGLNSFVIIYSDSLRAYGLGSALVVFLPATAWAFLKMPTPARFLLLTVVAVLTAQALFQNALLIAAVCAGAVAVCAKRKSWRVAVQIFLAGAIAAVSLLPYLPGIRAAQAGGAALRTGFRWDSIIANVGTLTSFPLGPYQWLWVLLVATILIGVFLGWSRRAQPDEAAGKDAPADLWLFAGTTLVTALVGFGAFLKWAALPTQVWYFIPLLALTTTCIEMGLPQFTGRGRALMFGFALATVLIATPFAWLNLKYRFTTVDLVTKQLNALVAPLDFVVVTPWPCGISFERYFKARTAWDTSPPLADHSGHRYDLIRERMQSTNAIQPLLEKIALTLQAGHRVWVVGDVDIPEPATAAPADLPPPPLKWSGWQDTPYNMVWEIQTAHFIRDHAERFEPIVIPINVRVNENENLRLLVAEGWRTNVVSPPPFALPDKLTQTLDPAPTTR